jgi:hypothetical protein
MAINDWRPELFRLTAFPAVLHETSWQSLTGAPPAETAAQPRLGQSHEAGPFANGLLRLIQERARIEWRYEALDTPEETFPQLGPVAEELPRWLPSMTRWLQGGPALRRIAFGAVLVHQVPNKETGYRFLASLLPAVRLDPAASDFLYQINRPRVSRSRPGVMINRLTTWSVRTVARLGIRLVGLQALPSDVERHGLACRLDLDINTAAEFEGTFQQSELPPIFDELVRLGTEIAEKGDIE